MSDTPFPMTMSVAQTVDYLVEALGGKATNWATWLSNDRKTGRTQKLPTDAGPGRPRYARAVADAFIDDQRAKRPQEVKDFSDGTSVLRKQAIKTDVESFLRRPFNPHISAITKEEEGFEGGEPYVFMVTVSPLAAYKLNAAQARKIAARLISAADSVELSLGDET